MQCVNDVSEGIGQGHSIVSIERRYDCFRAVDSSGGLQKVGLNFDSFRSVHNHNPQSDER